MASDQRPNPAKRERVQTTGVVPAVKGVDPWRWIGPYSRAQTEPYRTEFDDGRCTGQLECGGRCCLREDHPGPCLCEGDDIDEGPESCPA